MSRKIVWSSGKNSRISHFGKKHVEHDLYVIYQESLTRDPRRVILSAVRMVETPEDMLIVEKIDELLSKLKTQP